MEHGIIFNEDQRAELKSQFSTGVFAPEDRLKLRPDILMTDMTTGEIKTAEADFARQQRKRKADRNPPNRTHDVIKGQKIISVEIGYVADTRYEDKLSNKFDQHKLLCSCLHLKGMKCKFYPSYSVHRALYLSVFKGNDSTRGLQKQSDDISKKTQWSCPPELIQNHQIFDAQQICKLEEYCLWPCQWQMRIKCARGRLVIQTPRDVRLTALIYLFIYGPHQWLFCYKGRLFYTLQWIWSSPLDRSGVSLPATISSTFLAVVGVCRVQTCKNIPELVHFAWLHSPY